MESEEEQFIRVMLSRKKPKNDPIGEQLIRKIGKSLGSEGGLFSRGFRQCFVGENRAFYQRVVMKALIIKNKGQG